MSIRNFLMKRLIPEPPVLYQVRSSIDVRLFYFFFFHSCFSFSVIERHFRADWGSEQEIQSKHQGSALQIQVYDIPELLLGERCCRLVCGQFGGPGRDWTAGGGGSWELAPPKGPLFSHPKKAWFSGQDVLLSVHCENFFDSVRCFWKKHLCHHLKTGKPTERADSDLPCRVIGRGTLGHPKYLDPEGRLGHEARRQEERVAAILLFSWQHEPTNENGGPCSPPWLETTQYFFFFCLLIRHHCLFACFCDRGKVWCPSPENVEPWGLRDFLGWFQEVHLWDQESRRKGSPFCDWLGGTVCPVDQLFDYYLFLPGFPLWIRSPFVAQHSNSRHGCIPWTKQRKASKFRWKTLSSSRSSERAPLARSSSASRSALVASMRWKS